MKMLIVRCSGESIIVIKSILVLVVLSFHIPKFTCDCDLNSYDEINDRQSEMRKMYFCPDFKIDLADTLSDEAKCW